MIRLINCILFVGNKPLLISQIIGSDLAYLSGVLSNILNLGECRVTQIEELFKMIRLIHSILVVGNKSPPISQIIAKAPEPKQPYMHKHPFTQSQKGT